MKNLKITLATFAFVYFATSFMNLTVDFTKWTSDDRISFIILGTALSVIALLMSGEIPKSK